MFNLLVSDALEAGVLLDGCCGRSKHKIQKGEVSDDLWSGKSVIWAGYQCGSLSRTHAS